MLSRLLTAVCVVCVAAFSATAQDVSVIETDAEYAVIMDHDTGEILFSKRGSEPMVPASMTKIMTAQVVFDRLTTGELALADRFTVSENAWRKGNAASGGSTMFLEPGDTPTVAELLRGVIVVSGNDACTTLAEGISGSEDAFAREMTQIAQERGLTSANFKNASGLHHKDHVISAVDLARLAKIQIDEYPEMYAIYTEEEYIWNNIRQSNRNPILGKRGVDGLKTGHLSISGYGLVASAERGGKRRTIVINGLKSEADRAREADRLMRQAFNAFETRTIEPGEQLLAELPVALGTTTKIGVTLAEPFTVTAHKRAFPRSSTQVVYDGPLRAPIDKGDEVAKLVVNIDGKEPIILPLVATSSSARLGFFGKAIAGLSAMMEN